MNPALQTQGITTKPIFGGHETFTFRYGWLKKGVDAVDANSLIFTEDEALVRLGVGKNMVRSIRHWGLATGLMEEMPKVGASQPLRPTDLAKKLVQDIGWDPYLEREGSLWLLHWQLATNPVRGLVWGMTFSEYHETEFSKQALTNFLAKKIENRSIHTTRNMIGREVDCCLHTYTAKRAVKKQKKYQEEISEENFDCPLVELGLLRYSPEYDHYHFNIGPKSSLPPEVFGYALLAFINSKDVTSSTLHLDDCIYHSGSPGQIFKLDENSVVEYIETLEEILTGKIHLTETAGLSQIYFDSSLISDWQASQWELLQSYYE